MFFTIYLYFKSGFFFSLLFVPHFVVYFIKVTLALQKCFFLSDSVNMLTGSVSAGVAVLKEMIIENLSRS